jgi:hypothetical protein
MGEEVKVVRDPDFGLTATGTVSARGRGQHFTILCSCTASLTQNS